MNARRLAGLADCKQPETNLERSERRSSRQNARTEMQPGVMAGGALIPLSNR